MTFLRTSDVAVSFGAVRALNGVDIELGGGEIRALCGENGAGKSTLIKLIMGLIQPDRGIIEVDGVPQKLSDPQDAQRLGFALVSQELSLAPALTVLDNIWLGDSSTPRLYRDRGLRHRAEAAIQRLGVAIDLDARVESLSMGQRQLVEIARLIARNARCLILDEPTATLSDGEIAKLFAVLRDLRAQGHAILYVTHRLGEVFHLCDSVTVLRNGAHVATGKTSAFTRESLVEAMLGRAASDMYPPRSGKTKTAFGLQADCISGPGFDTLTFAAPRGQITSLVGQVGSGATDVVRAIAGLVPLSQGRISLDEHPCERRERRRSFAFISENRAEEGLFHRSILENLIGNSWERHASFGVVSWRSARTFAIGLTSTFGIDQSRLGADAFSLSGGNQQKVLFARAFGSASAKVLLMNEPTRGVDVGARRDLYQMMRRMCEEGFSILISSTDLEEVVGISDIILTMYRGSLVGAYEADSFDTTSILLDITHPPTGQREKRYGAAP